MTLPDSRWAAALSARFHELLGSRPNPDPYADAHEMAGAMQMPADFLPTRVFPMRPDDELLPMRDDLEDESE